MRRKILLLLSFTICLSQSQDTECEAGYKCEDSGDCQSYKVERDTLKQYQKGSSEFNRLLKKLRGLVCNKKLRKICCELENEEKIEVEYDPNDSESPSWVPSSEQCGLTGDAAFILGGQDTKLGEFPWMTLLGSRRKSGSIFWKCGAALINKW